jgi:hypothetical protein
LFNFHPPWLLQGTIVLDNPCQYILCWSPFANHIHRRPNFPVLEDFVALGFCEQGDLNGDNSLPNLGEHCFKSTGEELVPQNVDNCLVLTLSMLGVIRPVEGSAWDAIGES